MKKNGFTLVELLAVIVLLALLMLIAIPNAIKMAGRVKGQAFDTKIKLIEQSAKTYGQSNLALVRQGKKSASESSKYCKINVDSRTGDVVSIAQNGGSSDYPCLKMELWEIADAGDLTYDETDRCKGRTGLDYTKEENKKYQACGSTSTKKWVDNIIINSKTNLIMNKCNVYIYYKYKRVYAWFDKTACNAPAATSGVNAISGQSYNRPF